MDELLVKPNPGAPSSLLRAAELLDVFSQAQAVQDALLLSSQVLCRDLAQELLNKYILIFQKNVLIDSYIWHILQGSRFELET